MSKLKDVQAEYICQQLTKAREGFAALGIQTHLFEDVIKKITKQALIIDKYTSTEPFKAGYDEGRAAAFATGLITNV